MAEPIKESRKYDIISTCRTARSGRIQMSERRCGMLEAFVEEVRKHSCLYDESNQNDRDTVFKKTVWTAIATKFRLKNGVDAEKQWKIQRDRYTREKKKIGESVASGSSASELYKSSWYLYEILDGFLGKQNNDVRQSVSNLNTGIYTNEAADQDGIASDLSLNTELFRDSANYCIADERTEHSPFPEHKNKKKTISKMIM